MKQHNFLFSSLNLNFLDRFPTFVSYFSGTLVILTRRSRSIKLFSLFFFTKVSDRVKRLIFLTVRVCFGKLVFCLESSMILLYS